MSENNAKYCDGELTEYDFIVCGFIRKQERLICEMNSQILEKDEENRRLQQENRRLQEQLEVFTLSRCSFEVQSPVLENVARGRRDFNREDYPKMLPDGMHFRASAKHKTDKTMRVTMDIVFDAKTKCFIDKQGTVYNKLQDANRKWCNLRGYEKLGNAWDSFKALNLKTGKTRSIEFLHLDNWIEKEGARDYIL